MESSHCNGLPFYCDMDYGFCHGYRPRSCTRYEEISSIARYIFGQCAIHPLGISHVRTDWHSVVFCVAYGTGFP